jgi:1-acyl-sn-glycerol-3-phosphate acyltransferase
MMSPMDAGNDYDVALARAQAIYPGVRVGRPGRARTYRATVTGMQLLRARIKIDLDGAQHVAPGAAILVGNHLSTFDPVVAVMATWWRVTAFTKAEWFEGRSAVFFRWMGQIPLRRGDEAATEWALDMAARTLADGSKIGIYPEGTRGPDPTSLYRLHQRVLVPLITGNPGVPVHTIATTYDETGPGRKRARIRISERLPIDATSMTGEQIIAILRDSLVAIGHLGYVDQYAFVVKARVERERLRQEAERAGGTDTGTDVGSTGA